MTNPYGKYRQHLKKASDLAHVLALLHWDQETMMPEKGLRFRAQQLSTLAGMHHEVLTDKAYGDLLEELENHPDLGPREKRNVEISLKEFRKKKKYSKDFVEKLTGLTSRSFQTWTEARKQSDFSLFQPALEELVALKREEAEFLGYENHPYEALMDDYEPGATVAMLNDVFQTVRPALLEILDKVRSSGDIDDSFLSLKYDKDRQWDVGIHFLKQIGYDFSKGRQDISAHPFTTNFSPEDVRVTTRIDDHNPLDMISSCIHEGGHAIYEQGIDPEEYGLPSGEYCSLSIHESQSRLYENHIGRSLEFWEFNFPYMQEQFPGQLKGVSLQDFYRAANKVRPSLIRTQADELTYHFHIMVRYEIEKGLIAGETKVKELPSLWRERYKEYLGIEVPSDSQGVLQDVHWSHGSFGYFPTYSLGSFYAAQFFRTAEKEIGGLRQMIRGGQLHELKNWLNKNIHKKGKTYSSSDLCENVTKEKLNVDHFIEYLKEKYTRVYGW